MFIGQLSVSRLEICLPELLERDRFAKDPWNGQQSHQLRKRPCATSAKGRSLNVCNCWIDEGRPLGPNFSLAPKLYSSSRAQAVPYLLF